MTRREWLCAAPVAWMSAAGFSALGSTRGAVYVCPMDPDIRSPFPGVCPRCGMKLQVKGSERPEYQCVLAAQPSYFPAKEPLALTFTIREQGSPVILKDYELVHERLFHFFAVSEDLEWFLHDHPVLGRDGIFRLPVTFPREGMYLTFSDFFPRGGTPQWCPQFVYTAESKGAVATAEPRPKLQYTGSQRDGDVEVRLILDPLGLEAGRPSELSFDVRPGDGLEPWLGTYAHALWVSHDLLDAAHAHPEVFGSTQFQVYFPRAGAYRFWLQFQRYGVVHTVKFDIPVKRCCSSIRD